MKKWILCTVTVALVLCMCATAFAAENSLSIADGAGEAGQTVFLTVRLNTPAFGDTLAIAYDFDPAVLKAIPGSCRWEKSGALSDFNNKNAGVWAASTASELKGDICTLAFRINSGVSFESTKVSCTVFVKNGAQDVGTYTAAAMVNLSCKHSTYGEWTHKDDLTHTSTCTQCGNVQSGTHKWDAGMESPNPDEPFSTLLTLTCQSCEATKVIVVADSLSEPDGTKPGTLLPTVPDHNTSPTVPGGAVPDGEQPQATGSPDADGPQQNGGQTTPEDTRYPSDGDHTQTRPTDPQQTRPGDTHSTNPPHGNEGNKPNTPPNNSAGDSDHSDHDHTHDTDTGSLDSTSWIIGAIIFLVAAGLAVGGVILVMKKK